MNLNESKALFGIPISLPIEPEEKSLVISMGLKYRREIADIIYSLYPFDSNPMLEAFKELTLDHLRKLANKLAMRKR